MKTLAVRKGLHVSAPARRTDFAVPIAAYR
jgi:hypothetical protein